MLNQVFTNIEKAFNVAGCIPVLGIGSGIVRTAAGQVQTISGIILAGVGLIGQSFDRHHNTWKKSKAIGTEHIIHGVLNTFRGIGETWVGTTFGGVGSPLLLLPNLYKRKPFAPCYNYGFYANKKVHQISLKQK